MNRSFVVGLFLTGLGLAPAIVSQPALAKETHEPIVAEEHLASDTKPQAEHAHKDLSHIPANSPSETNPKSVQELLAYTYLLMLQAGR